LPGVQFIAELINERRSRRLPEGLLDQPFTAGLVADHCSEAASAGLPTCIGTKDLK